MFCVPNISSLYGLSILDCPFGFLWHLLFNLCLNHLAILGTQNTGWRQTKQKPPGNIGNTKHRMKTNKTKITWQYWEHKT
jgi:hypothetical protein